MSAQSEFAARLERIKTGGSNVNGTLFVGSDEAFSTRNYVPRSKRKQSSALGNTAYPLSLIGAAVLGMSAVVVGRYVRFHLLTGLPDDPSGSTDMAINGGIALAVSFVLSQMFRLTSKEHSGLQAAGVAAMVCTFHNLVHWQPDLFDLMFSPDWVGQVLATTQEKSILFRGVTFKL